MALLSIAIEIKQCAAGGKGGEVGIVYGRGERRQMPSRQAAGGRRYSYRKLGSFGDVGGLRSLLPLGDLELNVITFLKTLVTFRGDRAVVHEDVGTAVVAPDKTVALGVIEPLYRTFQTFHVRPLGTFSYEARPHPAFEAIVLPEKERCQGNVAEKAAICAALNLAAT